LIDAPATDLALPFRSVRDAERKPLIGVEADEKSLLRRLRPERPSAYS